MSRYHCRCRHCRTRRVLPKHPGEYAKLPKCRTCGKANYHVDQWMNNRDTRKAACFECGGYWFPHRMGSLYCHFRKDGTPRIIGESDFRDRNMSDEDVRNYLAECVKRESAPLFDEVIL